MHIDRTNEIPVADKATFLATPNPAFRFVLVSTSGTLATCSSFGASEAQDVGSFGFVSQVIDILAVFPQSHALIVVSATITIADAVWIADEETSYLLLNTEVNDLPRGFVSHITDTPFRPVADLILGSLQLFPTARILLAASLLLGDFSLAHGALPLETTNTTPRDNHRMACIGTHSSKMNFTQIDGGMNLTRRIFRLWDLDTDMQFKAVLPD
jgi:hypothetical protein